MNHFRAQYPQRHLPVHKHDVTSQKGVQMSQDPRVQSELYFNVTNDAFKLIRDQIRCKTLPSLCRSSETDESNTSYQEGRHPSHADSEATGIVSVLGEWMEHLAAQKSELEAYYNK